MLSPVIGFNSLIYELYKRGAALSQHKLTAIIAHRAIAFPTDRAATLRPFLTPRQQEYHSFAMRTGQNVRFFDLAARIALVIDEVSGACAL